MKSNEPNINPSLAHSMFSKSINYGNSKHYYKTRRLDFTSQRQDTSTAARVSPLLFGPARKAWSYSLQQPWPPSCSSLPPSPKGWHGRADWYP